MDCRKGLNLSPRPVVEKVALLVMAKCKRHTRRRAKQKSSPRVKTLVRRALMHSAQMLVAPSVSSLQEISAVTPERVVVNVGGTRYEIPTSHLVKFPNTLLGSERKNYFFDEERMEYFFDRDHVIFKNIIEFYRTGCFHVSPRDCTDAILDELKFFGIPKQFISECCCEHITLDDKKEDVKLQKAKIAPNAHTSVSTFPTAKERLWEFLTNTKSSVPSAVFGYLFGGVVLLNISAIVAETIPTSSGRSYHEVNPRVFFGLDSFCVGIFTVEYLARLYSAHQRLEFATDVSNVIDLLGIIPYYIGIVERVTESSNKVLDFFVTVFRMFRVFRITKLARHSERFQNLLRSVQGAATELGGILFSFLALMVTFSSILYYFEADEEKTKFVSIPAAFWYTLVTMTTLGYGDMVPGTVKGKLLGAVCALMGVLLLSLPVPIIEKKLIEFSGKLTPKRNNVTRNLAASLYSVSTLKKDYPRTRKKRTLVQLHKRPVSMVAEVGSICSFTSASFNTNNTTSENSSSDNLITVKTTSDQCTSEREKLTDLNCNRKVKSVAGFKHRSWHGNGDIPHGIENGIFTRHSSVTEHFPAFEDDLVRSLSSNEFSCIDENCETIALRKLKRQQSYKGMNSRELTVRNCHSAGELT